MNTEETGGLVKMAEEKKKKGFLQKILDKLDKKLESQAKSSCCCSKNNKKQGERSCSDG
ncbi:MAG: hypothetical protein K8S27_16430 [Candidatus Omnitrophica bacterium]|nr:hypothetical protein [Candidatus Omnitrophota bacterium]